MYDGLAIIIISLFGLQAAVKLDDNVCDTCEMIAGYAKIFLSNNETEAELASLLENDVCPQLGGFKDIVSLYYMF